MSDRAHRHDNDRALHSRSRSPQRHHQHARRQRSPHGDHHKRRRSLQVAETIVLPLNARQITKRDYEIFKPMFALYLDIQKGIDLEELKEGEVKGRWKSFIGKWNRGELAEGWYDPSTLQKAIDSTPISRPEAIPYIPGVKQERTSNESPKLKDFDPESDSDEFGPALPGQERVSRGSRLGPSIPNMSDLELKRETEAEDALARRDDLRFERKIDQKLQKEALFELAPRAEAGTRERQLEKKKEVNEKMKSFREKSPGAAEVPETELMGGGDGIADYKKQKQEFERKKNERELRKEEMLRARAAEREERLAEYKQKEDNTMAMLKGLAKQNFG